VGGLLLPPLHRLMTAQLPPPEEEKAIKEAIELADQILRRPDIDQYPLLKARALATRGLWTQALNTYVRGLKPHLSREHYEGLKYIVENHPAQRRPDQQRVPHPVQAEKHYSQGLTRYFARDYAQAEKEFSRAIENFDRDARYHYFLGLAQLAQGKRGSQENFEQGARLESDNRPTQSAVNAALERIQGDPRRLINEARARVP
jgi:tetratricopeptide (TPR) repeat protein